MNVTLHIIINELEKLGLKQIYNDAELVYIVTVNVILHSFQFIKRRIIVLYLVNLKLVSMVNTTQMYQRTITY